MWSKVAFDLIDTSMEVVVMKDWASLWGVFGVAAAMGGGAVVLFPDWNEVVSNGGYFAFGLLAFWLTTLAYFEGYRGFYRFFSPMVVRRSRELEHQNKPVYVVLAPLFCIGFLGSSLVRKMQQLMVVLVIATLVFALTLVSLPWRWMLEFVVALNLFEGMFSVMWFGYREWNG